MPPGISLWHSLLVRHAASLKAAVQRASQALDTQIARATSQQQASLQTILVRNTPKQPLHPLARIRQTQSRWYTSARNSLGQGIRNFSSSSASRQSAGKTFRERFAFAQSSRVGGSINRSSGRAPFASTLRPNLTGGALGRTAGGYAIGSGRVGTKRFFSHGPASQAQVVQNVSQGMRAFFLGGHKARFDGVSAWSGEKRYRAISAVRDDAEKIVRGVSAATPGATLRFAVNPTITALQRMDGVVGFAEVEKGRRGVDHLNSEGVLDALSVDFSRALRDLAAVLGDLKRLSALGNLPISTDGMTLQVHFPGCDAETVERLCAELGVLRGTVVQDEDFDAFAGTEIALLFPFAPSEHGSECESSMFEPNFPLRGGGPVKQSGQRHVIRLDDMLISQRDGDEEEEEEGSCPAFSTLSDTGMDPNESSYHEVRHDLEDVLVNNYTAWSAWEYESVSLRSSGGGDGGNSSVNANCNRHGPLEYQGFEGIYRFLEELEAVRR